MTIVWRPSPLWLLIAAIATGCGGVRASSSVPPPRVHQRLEDAEALARAGQYAEARAAYDAILASGARADGALIGLARDSIFGEERPDMAIEVRSAREPLFCAALIYQTMGVKH